jgi:preprotein translocase subunit YajC
MLEFLAAGAGSTSQGLISFVPIIGMVLIFWFLIIRPQMKQQKAHRAKVAAVKRGDQIVTSSGITGKVTKVDDEYVEAEIAQGVKVKIVRSMLGDVLSPATSKPAND